MKAESNISVRSPSHLSPCRTSPHSISPQWSQKAGARYEWTNRQCGRIWKSSTVAEAAEQEKSVIQDLSDHTNSTVVALLFLCCNHCFNAHVSLHLTFCVSSLYLKIVLVVMMIIQLYVS